ncbi:MAG: hypothetical protein K8R23_20630 [Chthoniobacter sp.]|nr:hypothetical protein [Chthoniobacter sp.]
MSAPDDHPRSVGRFATRIVWTVLGLALAYVLSSGPASVIAMRFCQVRGEDPPALAAKRAACYKALEAFYVPLVAVCGASKTEPQLELYAGWWIYTFQPKGGYRRGNGHQVFSSPTSEGYVPDPPPSAPASRTFAPDIPRYLSIPYQPPPASPPFALDITPYRSFPSPLPPEPPLVAPDIPLYLSVPAIPPTRARDPVAARAPFTRHRLSPCAFRLSSTALRLSPTAFPTKHNRLGPRRGEGGGWQLAERSSFGVRGQLGTTALKTSLQGPVSPWVLIQRRAK